MLNNDHPWVLTACGDLMFYGPMADQMQLHNDPVWGFRPLGDSLLKGDVLFGNFETPISLARRNVSDAPDKYFSPAGISISLKKYGFNVVNLAQNHIYDFGEEGVKATLDEMRSADLLNFGIGFTPEEASAPIYHSTASGIRVAFIGYTTAAPAVDKKHKYVACFPDIKRVKAHIHQAKQQADAVIVSCHTGAQYNPYPAPETRKLAAAAISAGASVFLGHHPHVPNGYERIGNGLALYSLGDFITPVHNEQTRRTFFARIQLCGDQVVGQEIIPCYITDDCQTTIAEGELRHEIISHIDNISQAISDGRSDNLHFSIARNRFYSQYITSWIQEFRYGGLAVLFRKIRNFRYYHFQLIGRTIKGLLTRIILKR